MTKKTVSLLLGVLLSLLGQTVFALSPEQLFSSGKSSFENEKWQECVEFMDRLTFTWPDHPKKAEAKYYRSIAAIRDLDRNVDQYRAEQTQKIVSDFEEIAYDLPEDFDVSELKAASAASKKTLQGSDWLKEINIAPDELKHHILRGRCPDPSEEPLITLEWLALYENNESIKEPELRSLVELLRVKAIWRLMLSPWAAKADEKKLKELKLLPLSSSFQKALRTGFRLGKPDTKRELALYGCHYDFLKSRSFETGKTPSNSKWFDYLQERGLRLKDAVCPF